jgi:tetratricopeptide (TPR) repeat protein
LDRKHCRRRLHVLLLLAGLILISLESCSSPGETVREEECYKCVPAPSASQESASQVTTKQELKEDHFQYPTSNFLRSIRTAGDFDNAVKQSQETLSQFPKTPPGDKALFDMGLVYAHPGNPKKDYRKSMEYFKRVLKEFPRSQFTEEARVWIGVLEDIEKATKVDIEIEEKKKELSK